DFWTWDLNQRADGSMVVILTNCTEKLRASMSLYKWLGRFGASTNATAWGILVLGGISLHGCIPQQYEIILLNSHALMSSLTDGPSDKTAILSTVGLGVDFEGPHPLLIGHASYAISCQQVLIVGGGAVCFSFGIYWNEGIWLLQDAASHINNE